MQTPKANKQNVWRGEHLGWHFRIVHWGEGGYTNNGRGTWNYYVYLSEQRIGKEAFEKLWLAPEVKKWSPESKGYVSYDYFNTPVSDLPWHGGVTYYDKHGEVEGFRSVEFGCDYSHLYDDQVHWTLDLVLFDVAETIEAINALYPSDPKA